MRAAKALARLRECAASSEPLLFDDAIRAKISRARSTTCISLVKTYLIAKFYTAMGWVTSSYNLSYDPSPVFHLQMLRRDCLNAQPWLFDDAIRAKIALCVRSTISFAFTPQNLHESSPEVDIAQCVE